jgi:hypothetical protein
MMGNQRDKVGGRVVSQSIPFMNINHPIISIGEREKKTRPSLIFGKNNRQSVAFICKSRHQKT